MAKPPVRIRFVEVGVCTALVLLVGRAAQVQLLQGRRWAEEAQAQRTERIVLAARRGTLFDRHGAALALTQETYHVGIAPNELRDPPQDGARITHQLGISARAWSQALRKRYAYFAGPFSVLEVQPLRSVRGVHFEPVLNRFYPAPELARATIGRVGDDGRGASGLERTLDSLLAGRPGAAVVLKDRAGREYESPARVIAQPVAGHDVVLTLDAELQEIAQRALDDALRRMDADGGDVVMLDPATGELLAIASRRREGTPRASAFTDTFEPGSVAKIFAAAALLSHRRVRPAERVSGEGGRYRLPGRTITDEDPQPSLTLADAIRVSSNIALVKFAARLTAVQQYGTLRDFGFGAPTGIEFPAEAEGTLRPPAQWTRLSPASLAMGYELSVTPIQVAMAYAALAHDGLLLQPTLVKEVRSAAGKLLYRHRPEPVRRAVSAELATRLRVLLRGVVEGGTGSEAALANFPVAAKTGTARRVVNGRYAPGQYTASFAALFPADRPQLVLVVKIDNPHKGSYFAAQTAAPVTRSMLEQALAARTVALDRARLSTAAPRTEVALGEDDGGVVPYVVPWPYRPDSAGVSRRRPVPDVAGLGLREAVRTLHRRGFRVALKGWGAVEHTWPAGGDSAAVGATVTVFARPIALPPGAPAPVVPPALSAPALPAMSRLPEIITALERAGLLVQAPDLHAWPEITGLSADSRRIEPGMLYCAVRGSVQDGHEFLGQARARGAVAALVEREEALDVPQILVRDSRRAAVVAAETWYRHPAAELDLIGVTGTNGKTTSVTLARHVLAALEPMGSIGTLGAFDPAGRAVPSEAGNLTTPGPIDLQATLAALVALGARGAAMEVSSHSLDQGRVDGLAFRAAIFTNLTRDHLDYHKTMEQYFKSKAKLLQLLAPGGLEVVNADDPAWQRLRKEHRRVTFGERSGDVAARRVMVDASGARFELVTPTGSAPVRLPLLGRFNVANALGVAACAWGMGVDLDTIAQRLGDAPQIPGRMERIAERPCTVLRDYAHTADALERALETLRPLTSGRLIVVFGAGGDRDPGKRAPMGEVCARLADIAIATSDNPRTEDPEQILDQVEAGMRGKPHHREVDRRKAIALALQLAQLGDTILLAGKGHESYQVVGTEKQPFDERVVIRELGAS